MLWILQFFIRHRLIASLALVCTLCALMISSDAPQRSTISRALAMTVFFPVQITVDQFTRIKTVFSETTRLKQEVAILSVRTALLSEQASENGRLRSMLDLKGTLNFDCVPARVIGREPSQLSRSIVINIGRDKGIERYMPVIGLRGLVGRVVQPLQGISLVQLLSDPLNRTSITNARSRVTAILETETGRSFFVRFPSHADLTVGDTLVTSGLGGIYPKGLLVGTVERTTGDPDPLFKITWIKTFADFNALEDVFVLRYEPQWHSFRTELDSLGIDR